jgi:hypothetical protein
MPEACVITGGGPTLTNCSTAGAPGGAIRGKVRLKLACLATKLAQPLGCCESSSEPFWNPALRESPITTVFEKLGALPEEPPPQCYCFPCYCGRGCSRAARPEGWLRRQERAGDIDSASWTTPSSRLMRIICLCVSYPHGPTEPPRLSALACYTPSRHEIISWEISNGLDCGRWLWLVLLFLFP